MNYLKFFLFFQNYFSLRWRILILVSIPMVGAYFLADSLSSLETQLEIILGWKATDYSCYIGAYGWFNVFLFMLIFGGIILDKIGIRFTGILSICIMLFGTGIKYFVISGMIGTDSMLQLFHISIKKSVLVAGIGFAFFGIGIEMFGITANKAIFRWFKNREFAMATGLNTATGRIGTSLALFYSIPLVNYTNKLYAPIIVAITLLVIGLFAFFGFIFLDKKLDKGKNKQKDQEKFKLNDLKDVIKIKAFWLITALAVLFYTSVITFIKYATLLIHQKFHVSNGLVGYISSLLPLIALILTPIFGNFYDKKGKGASLMIFGCSILFIVYLLFAIPALHTLYIAIGLILILGIAFSLIPAILWPAIAKVIPERKLGTVYAMIVWTQNLGYTLVPAGIGYILNHYCTIGEETRVVGGTLKIISLYDYTFPMLLFACLGALSILFAYLLKMENDEKKYGLENPNIVQK